MSSFPGPILWYELRRSARHWQNYAVRSAVVAILFAAVLIVWRIWVGWRYGPFDSLPIKVLAQLGPPLYLGVVCTQLTVMLFAAPAIAAGAVCLDRARGTLAHLLTTDVSAAEIILGKLGPRLGTVLGLVACSLPVMAICILLGGVDPEAVFGACLVTTGVSLLGCTLALTLSVWGERTHEVLLFSYLLGGLALLIWPAWWLFGSAYLGPVPDWIALSNPFWLILAPYLAPRSTGLTDDLLFLGGCLLGSIVLAAIAASGLRRVTARREGRAVIRGKPLRLPTWYVLGPVLDFNPVLWLTWARPQTSRGMHFLWLIYAGCGLLLTPITAMGPWPPERLTVSSVVSSLLVAIGLLFVAILSAARLAEARARGTLAVVLTTPLETWCILTGYWWGAFRLVPPITILPAVVVVCQRRPGDWISALCLIVLVLCYGAGVVSVGIAAAVWCSRPSRAVTMTVVMYALATVGWIVFVANALPFPPFGGVPFAIGSPWYGPLLLTADQFENWRTETGHAWVVWAVVYLLAAVVLFLTALATFDPLVGRMPARSRLVEKR